MTGLEPWLIKLSSYLSGLSQKFALSEEERSRLLEAISHAETAAVTLRKKGRLNVLFDVLSGLTAFYPAVGDCEKAAIAAKEALQITPNDATILRNLWCIQMRMFKFDDAAGTAATLQELDDFMEWWGKRCEALIQADRAQEVIDSWQASKNDPRFSANSDVIAIIARALSRQHQTEEGLDLLNQNLQVKSDDPVLLLERAQLLEDLGNLDAARKDIDNASQHAAQQKHILAQALVSKGMFHFRHGEWKDAAKVLQELGGDV